MVGQLESGLGEQADSISRFPVGAPEASRQSLAQTLGRRGQAPTSSHSHRPALVSLHGL